MALSLVRLGFLSLNACASATVGGLCTYCIFGGENKEERQQVDAIYLQIEKDKEQFKLDKQKAEKDRAEKLVEAKGKLEAVQRIQSCLKDKDEIYKKELERLGFSKYFKIVRYSGEHCLKRQ